MGDMFWTVFGLGFVVVASPGPVTLATIRQGVARGYRPALAVQIGALGTALVWGIVVLAGLAPLARRLDLEPALTAAGGAALLWAAWRALVDTRAVPRPAPPASRGVRRAALAGALYAASNPAYATVWFGVAGALATGGVLAARPSHIALVAGAYTLGALCWGVPLAAVVAGGRRLVTPGFWRWWHGASGLALGGYGLHLLWALRPW
jgi:chemosensory pili system protein ChpE